MNRRLHVSVVLTLLPPTRLLNNLGKKLGFPILQLNLKSAAASTFSVSSFKVSIDNTRRYGRRHGTGVEVQVLKLQVVEMDSGNAAAVAKVAKLKPIVDERREKMKDEMIGVSSTSAKHVSHLQNFQ